MNSFIMKPGACSSMRIQGRSEISRSILATRVTSLEVKRVSRGKLQAARFLSQQTASNIVPAWKRSNSACRAGPDKIGDTVGGAEVKDKLDTRESSAVSKSAAETDADAEFIRGKSLRDLFAAVIAAAVFGAGVVAWKGPDAGEAYFASYVLEQSLAIDNLLVFGLIFGYFKIPVSVQPRALRYGLYGAAVLRLIVILAGEILIEKFRPTLLVLALILVYSSFTILTKGDDDDDDEELADNAVVKFCSKLIPVSPKLDGEKFFTMVDGVKTATPLLLVVAILEISDIVFAVDSIPAIFGVTTDPFVVYSSNLFALASLRSLYYFVETIVADLEYVEPAVGIILGFIGGKIVADFAGYDISTAQSLTVVLGLLSGGVALSLLQNSQKFDNDID
ncbi:hypothetical protein CYMTET_17404 [Cymbomonas tetramitiformis]|uniref:Thylakoid membrane protein TERC, chloroplastic n=1 Tax=Cymbomonas tetramitiformis TaxID=36881 RepID=A0AAE0L759_9CHLO|nr:hypothetical protein CYMTET_17404 [Cymbomonas tetramitiformis]